MTKFFNYDMDCAEDLVAIFKNVTEMKFLTAYSPSYSCDFSLETRHLFLNSEIFMEKKLRPMEQGWLTHALAHAYSQNFFLEKPFYESHYKKMLNEAAKYHIEPLMKDFVATMKRLKEEWRGAYGDALTAKCESLLDEMHVVNPYTRKTVQLYACGFHTPKFQEARSIVSNMYDGQIEVPKYGLNDGPLWYDEVF